MLLNTPPVTPPPSCDSGQFVISILIKSLSLGINDGEPYMLFLNLSSMFYFIFPVAVR